MGTEGLQSDTEIRSRAMNFKGERDFPLLGTDLHRAAMSSTALYAAKQILAELRLWADTVRPATLFTLCVYIWLGVPSIYGGAVSTASSSVVRSWRVHVCRRRRACIFTVHIDGRRYCSH